MMPMPINYIEPLPSTDVEKESLHLVEVLAT